MPDATWTAPARVVRIVTWLAIGVALALVPFESRFQLGDFGGSTVTALHVALAVAIVGWLAGLVMERRLPHVPRPLAIALGIVLAVGLASAFLADGHNDEAYRTVARSGAAWLFFVVLVDLVRSVTTATRLGAVMVASCTVAALIGIVLLFGPPTLTITLLGFDYTVADARRLQATFGYPTTAAMAFEACSFVAIGLLGFSRDRRARWLAAGAAVVLVGAAILTLSRGAALGFGAGFLTIALAALLASRRRIASLAAATGAAVLGITVLANVVALPTERLWTDSQRELFRAAYTAPAEVRTSAQDTTTVPVTVTNTGAATWRPPDFRLVHHWLDVQTRAIVADGAEGADVGNVAPGASVTINATIRPPAASGTWLIAWDIEQGTDEWFSELGVPVGVTRVSAGSAPPPVEVGGPPATTVLFPALVPNPSRAELWEAAASMISERPLLGVGPGTYRLRYGTYLGWPAWDERIHSNNMYLEVAATTGLVGLAAFLFVILYALIRQFRVLTGTLLSHVDPRSWLLLAGFAAAAVAFLAHGVVDYFLGFSSLLVLHWSILGLGLGLALGLERGSGPGAGAPR